MDGHNLLRSFSNVKNLCIDRGLVEEFSRSLNSDSHLNCYPNHRKSHVSELAVPLVRLDRSSMLARIQVSLYTSCTIRTCTGSPSTDSRSSVSSGYRSRLTYTDQAGRQADYRSPARAPIYHTGFHIHCSQYHLVEDLATPNILQIYGTLIDIYLLVSYVLSLRWFMSYVRHAKFGDDV